MAGSVSTEDAGSRPVKTPKVDEKAIVESKPPSTFDRLLMIGEPEKDEYVRQYLLFRCQYYQTRGFGIEWEKFDYHFSLCYPYDGAPPNFMNQSNEERIKEVTQLAIDKYNQDNGTNIVFVEHVSANYRCYGYFAHWVTFWGRDMSSPCPVSKLYQAKILHRRHSYQFPIFRVKPTDEGHFAPSLLHNADFAVSIWVYV
ncbi:unnamed protein product [Thlaspi arvense]|uniref:Uncharacterized protein n=1 Tax=Thlaspi arvense TaxID=13288 RepID=A0AAU9SPF2_THLAR|nr:unnamed protein product [Thlaspi arvense]